MITFSSHSFAADLQLTFRFLATFKREQKGRRSVIGQQKIREKRRWTAEDGNN